MQSKWICRDTAYKVTNSLDVNESYFRGNERSFSVARNRDKNREKVKEERLESKNEYGIKDSVPQEAVNNIIEASKE